MMAIKKWNFLFFLSFFEVVAALHSVLVSLPDITSCLLGLLKMNRILPPLNYANQMHIPFLPFDDYGTRTSLAIEWAALYSIEHAEPYYI